MTTFALGFALAWVLAIIKEHGDRKKPVKILEFVPGNRPGEAKWLGVNKSWWEQIKERMKPIVILALGIGLTLLAIKIATGT